MNIIQAREAAMAGKTVISPFGIEWNAASFNKDRFDSEQVFGEWSIKKEPVVFEATVWKLNTLKGEGAVSNISLHELIGKNVRVTVEVINDDCD